jgi:hypothetical protein
LCGAGIVVHQALNPTSLDPLTKAAVRLLTTDADLSQQVTAAVGNLKTPALWYAACGLAWAVLVSLHSFYLAFREDSETADRSDPYHLRAPLVLLDHAIRRRRKLGTSGDDLKKFRATLHKPMKGRHIQCVPYAGWQQPGVPDGGVGRRWSNRSGLVGQIIRRDSGALREPLISKMPETVKNESDFYDVLNKTWSYDGPEARAHAPMRLSSMAVPITDGDERTGLRVIGVVYCDSTERDFFDEEIQELCVLTAHAIAEHLRFAASIGA